MQISPCIHASLTPIPQNCTVFFVCLFELDVIIGMKEKDFIAFQGFCLMSLGWKLVGLTKSSIYTARNVSKLG